MKKQERGITLIALVVTIVVLLILATVSISMLGGENGIITQAQNAKLETRAGEVEERVNLWKSEKISSKYTNATVKTEDELLEEMKTDKILFEDEIDRENKLITIGTREISYKLDEETGEVTLEPDTGKEELILEYTVGAGDTIELPYNLTYYDINDEEKSATFDFQVDWGDGTIVTGINNSNIETEEKSKHQYTKAGTYEVKIKGTYESLNNCNSKRLGYDKLTKVKQWGTTGLKNIVLAESTNLSEIVTPTEGSFKELIRVYFADCTSLKSIPDKLFANCTNIEDVEWVFSNCASLTAIGDYAFANCINIKNFGNCFTRCTNLEIIGDNVFVGCINVESFIGCFLQCTKLKEIPDDLFVDCINVQEFAGCFEMCINLEGESPKLWLRVQDGEKNGYIGIPDGESCFYNCTKLDNYNLIPEYWKKQTEVE